VYHSDLTSPTFAVFPITSYRLSAPLLLFASPRYFFSMSAPIYVVIDQGIYWEKTNSL
jgi:hypothetical protein